MRRNRAERSGGAPEVCHRLLRRTDAVNSRVDVVPRHGRIQLWDHEA
jgi:hypothetical protein